MASACSTELTSPGCLHKMRHLVCLVQYIYIYSIERRREVIWGDLFTRGEKRDRSGQLHSVDAVSSCVDISVGSYYGRR